MKKYEAPVVELEVFSVENVMTGASGASCDTDGVNCPDDSGLF